MRRYPRTVAAATRRLTSVKAFGMIVIETTGQDRARPRAPSSRLAAITGPQPTDAPMFDIAP